MLLENLREGNACYTVQKALAELCSTVMWKSEFVSDRTFAEISKKSIESVAWCLLAAYIKYERKEIN